MSNIKSIRDRLGLTQAGLAEGIGCTQGNVGHYEKGQTVPPEMAKRLIGFALTRGLDLTCDRIYGDAGLPERIGPVGATATPETSPQGA